MTDRGAIVFTDIVGFTELTNEHGDDVALALLERQEVLVHELLPECGRVVKELGDGLLLWFDDATRRCTRASRSSNVGRKPSNRCPWGFGWACTGAARAAGVTTSSAATSTSRRASSTSRVPERCCAPKRPRTKSARSTASTTNRSVPCSCAGSRIRAARRRGHDVTGHRAARASAGLLGDGVGLGERAFRVEVPTAQPTDTRLADRAQVLVQRVDERLARRQVELDDVVR